MERRVRVATRAFTEYNEGKVANLPGIEHVEMEEFFSADYAESAKDMRAAEAAGILQFSPVSGGKQQDEALANMTKVYDDTAQVTDAPALAGDAGAEVERTDNHDDTSSTTLEDTPAEYFDDIRGLEIYGLTYKAEEYLHPVIDVSLDLGAQFPQNSDVPSPFDFIREYDALVRCVIIIVYWEG